MPSDCPSCGCHSVVNPYAGGRCPQCQCRIMPDSDFTPEVPLALTRWKELGREVVLVSDSQLLTLKLGAA